MFANKSFIICIGKFFCLLGFLVILYIAVIILECIFVILPDCIGKLSLCAY